jgi:hypothetical protein
MLSSLRDEAATASESDNVLPTLPPANQLLRNPALKVYKLLLSQTLNFYAANVRIDASGGPRIFCRA